MRYLEFVCARHSLIGTSLFRSVFLVSVGFGFGAFLLPQISVAEGLVIKGNPLPPLEGGIIFPPKPRNRDDDFPPGCTIAFQSGPGILGPPCAFKCENMRDTVDYQKTCTKALPGYGDYYIDENWNLILNKDPPPNTPHCIIFKAAPGPKIGSAFFPEGHHRCHRVSGDPHMRSYDGFLFDFQASGEFIASTSLDDNFEVQIRLEPSHPNKMISGVTGIAVRFGDDRISIRTKAEKPLRVNGTILALKDYTSQKLKTDGALIVRNGKRYTVILPDGTNVHATNFPPLAMHLHILLPESRDGRMKGLSGNGDGDPSNDFNTREEKKLAAPPPFDVMHGEFADSWRVTPETTLFDYEPGESTATFVKANTSAKPVTMEQISLEGRTRAEQACRAAGLRTGSALDECIFDYALTGEADFIESALALQIPAEWEPESDKTSIDFPSRAFAAHSITLNLNGPVKRGSWIAFAPKGSSSSVSPGNSYSEVVLLGKEKKVQIAVPMKPGQYELHYLEKKGASKLAESVSFEAVLPSVEISAPDSAPAGGDVEVKVTGDIGSNMLLSVVPLGSPDNTNGISFPVKQGSQFTEKIRYLPKKPGKYEIRCTGNFSKKKNIYARRPLVIE